MKNPKSIYFLIITGLFFSCADNTNKNNQEKIADKEVFDPVKYVDKNITRQGPDCKASPENCARVKVSFPEITGVPGALDKDLLNKQIQKALLKGSLDPEGKVGNVEGACKNFISDFLGFKEQMQQEVAGWSIAIDIKIINNDANYLSLRIDEDAYLGGAHPNQYTSFLNYDISTGQVIGLGDLINDTARLKELAEKQFREAKNLSPGENLNEAGYLFDEGKFTLTENFGISQGKLLLYYNNYDIAPYALGPTLLELPLETIL